MLRLNLLGAVDLADASGHSLTADIGGNKPLAVLIYLVLKGRNRPVRRDTITGLLWPDAEQKNARQSLTQAVHQIRAVIGDVVSSRGQEELTVDVSQITCDCFEFEKLAEAGRLEEAVGVYRGDVANGFYVKDAGEFDAWLSSERQTWRKRYAAVIQKLFETAIGANDVTAGIHWAEKLLELTPENEQPIEKALRALLERGQAPAAIRLFDAYKQTLHDEFGLPPSPHIAKLMGGIPQADSAPVVERRAEFRVGNPAARSRGSLAKAALALAVFVITIVGLFELVTPLPSKVKGDSAIYEGAPPKVAVLPFAYEGSTSRAAAVLNDALQWRLRDSGFQILNPGKQDTAAIRKLVGVNGQRGILFIVGGEVESERDGSLGARLWLKDAGSGKRVWESRFAHPQPDAHLIVSELSDAVAKQIRRAAGTAMEFETENPGVSADSWKAVYQARERMEAASDMQRAGSAAGSATELQDAETRLVEVSKHEPDWALPIVLRARIAEARASTALIGGDPKRGAAELEHGIRLLTSAAQRLDSEDVYELRALLQYKRWIFGVDDVAEANRLLSRAETDLRKALAGGQERSGSYMTLSGVMFAQGKYAESFVYARRAYDSNVFLRSNEEILNRLFNSALHAGDDAGAAQWCKEMQTAQPGKWPAVMCRVHLAGFVPQMFNASTLEHEIERLVAAPPIRRVMVPRLKAAYAITLAQLGNRDSARATLASLSAHQSDPEITLFSAFALTALKDAPQAHAHLRKYLAENQGTRSSAMHMRWLH